MKSQLERMLLLHVLAAGLPTPYTQYKFCAVAAWAADFAWPEAHLLVECDGGDIWRGGSRHTSGIGFTRDCEKLNFAAALGFRVLRVTGEMIDSGEALRLIETALGRRLVDELLERRKQEIAAKRSAGARKAALKRRLKAQEG